MRYFVILNTHSILNIDRWAVIVAVAGDFDAPFAAPFTVQVCDLACVVKRPISFLEYSYSDLNWLFQGR